MRAWRKGKKEYMRHKVHNDNLNIKISLKTNYKDHHSTITKFLLLNQILSQQFYTEERNGYHIAKTTRYDIRFFLNKQTSHKSRQDLDV